MLGAIIGDIIGSTYESHAVKTTDFPLFTEESHFTDDSVMTIAVARAILDNSGYGESMKHLGRRYPMAGYGLSFFHWICAPEIVPYNSWGNGSAMRVSPVGFAFETEEDVLREAARSAEVSHNHPEGIKGAQATALAIFLARKGSDKESIRGEISRRFGYDLNRTVDEIRPEYSFDVSCQGSVPESIIAFLDSHNFESAVRNAVSLGGDSDTMACISGGIAEAFYREIPSAIAEMALERVSEDLLEIIDLFRARYPL